jgi:hypothetical protein
MKLNKTMILLAVFASNWVSAQHVDLNSAKKVAENFYTEHSDLKEISNETISLSSCSVENNDTLLYFFNVGSSGFVIVSGDYSVNPILAYSTEGNFIVDSKQKGLELWLKKYSKSVSIAKSLSVKETNPLWDKYLTKSSLKSIQSLKVLVPLLTTTWDQGMYYNYHCPEFPAGPDGKCVTGCIATAMAQIMKYYNYPVHGFGNHSYYHPYFVSISANFDTTFYNWPVMVNHLTNFSSSASKEAISTLMYQCGVAVDMNYSPVESGSFVDLVPQTMQQYFNYRISAHVVDQFGYTSKTWKALLYDELDMHHPILYSGSGSSGGHAWVCDGYQDTSYFHFNWGWGGANNGYFTIDTINSGNGDFSNNQQVVIGLVPYDAPYCLNSKVLTQRAKQINDGSEASYYWNNTHCGWLIQPEGGADKIVLTFSDFQTEAGSDILSVYDGSSSSGILLGSFSGHTLPPALIANSGSMFIQFSTDSTGKDLGWDASYSSISLGVDENKIGESIIIYPVPAKDILNVILPSNMKGATKISFYNVMGEIVYSENCNAQNSPIISDISHLNSGLYIIEIECGNRIIHKSLIKN